MADGPFNGTHEQYGCRFLSAPGDFIDSSRFSLLCRPFPLYYGRGSSLSTSHGDRVCFSLAGTGLHVGGHTFSLSDKRPLSSRALGVLRRTFLISGSWLSSSVWKDCRIPVTWSCFSSCVSASSGYCLFLVCGGVRPGVHLACVGGRQVALTRSSSLGGVHIFRTVALFRAPDAGSAFFIKGQRDTEAAPRGGHGTALFCLRC